MSRSKLARRVVSAFAAAALLSLLIAPSSALAEAAPSHWDWATGPSIHDVEGERDWSVDALLYLWLSSINGDLGLPATGTIPVSATFNDLASALESGFEGMVDFRYRRWHLISDNSWVSLAIVPPPPTTGPVTGAQINSQVAFGTVAVAYELPLGQSYAVDVYLGCRWWHTSDDALLFTSGPGGPFAGSIVESWADAVVGARISYAITDRWNVGADADIGGGAASLDWSVLAKVGYDFNDHVGMTVAYRILGVDYSKQGFVYDIRQNGLLLGLNLRY